MANRSVLDIIGDDRVVLPITETGYPSYFVQRETVEALGSPVAYACAWLDHEAESPA